MHVPDPRSTDAGAAAQALVEAATTAGYAPSIHDTQPWRWRVIGKVLDLHLERGRIRAATDPDTRLATLSCGAALHHARVTLAAQGWRVAVVRLPDRADAGHLAQLHIEGRTPGEPQAALQLRTVPLRHTDRRPVTGEPVDADRLAAIAAAVAAQDTWSHTLTPDQVRALAAAAGQARRTETGAGEEPAWRSELAYWTGTAGRDAGCQGAPPISADDDKAAVFVLLHGRSDEPRDWIRAGEALSAGWLAATEHGVSVLPLSAPIGVAGTRQVLRTALPGPGYPFLVLRLGRVDPAEPRPPHAPRRPVGQIIDQV